MQPKKDGLSLRSLSVQFSLIILGIPTLVLMGFGLYQIKTNTIALEAELNKKLANEAAQLSASLSTALFNFDDETCQVIVKAALNKPEIIKIIIRDLNEPYMSAGKGYKLKDVESKVVQYPFFLKRNRSASLNSLP
ncbi:MAG: hypothetical protein HUK40_10740 [Desulfobacter sp.]|nr:hypothetical protein [Desulfobacter sp.]WDP84555.1 MAG: hypothetical protein HUN05_04825 [Desulfobacter sp.]